MRLILEVLRYLFHGVFCICLLRGPVELEENIRMASSWIDFKLYRFIIGLLWAYCTVGHSPLNILDFTPSHWLKWQHFGIYRYCMGHALLNGVGGVSCSGHRDHHRISFGWSSTWLRSNASLSGTEYEQIPIILIFLYSNCIWKCLRNGDHLVQALIC